MKESWMDDVTIALTGDLCELQSKYLERLNKEKTYSCKMYTNLCPIDSQALIFHREQMTKLAFRRLSLRQRE